MTVFYRNGLWAAVALVLGCSSDPPAEAQDGPDLFADLPADGWGETSDLSDIGTCPSFSSWLVGTVASDRATEISGIAASRKNANVLWGHNDSGGGRTIFAFSALDGAHLGDYRLNDARNRDWEDMAIGPGPEPGLDYLYVADIGDNDRDRDEVHVYRVAEPFVDVNDPAFERIELEDVVRLDLVYDDDKSHDAEGLFVDPTWGDLYLLTKSQDGDRRTRLFVAPSPLEPRGNNLAYEVLDDHEAESFDGRVLGVDASADGDRVILLTRGENVARLWYRPQWLPLWATFLFDPCPINVPDAHLEAITFDPQGQDFFVVPEGEHPDLYRLSYLEQEPP